MKPQCLRGHLFTPENTRIYRGKRCCRACHRWHRARTRPERLDLRGRLLAQSIPEPNSGCWLWLGNLAKTGYGTVGIGRRSLGAKRTAYAHRASYEVFVKKIPAGLQIDHLCHLEPVTAAENTRRALAARPEVQT